MNRRDFIKQSKWCLALLAPMPVLADEEDDMSMFLSVYKGHLFIGYPDGEIKISKLSDPEVW